MVNECPHCQPVATVTTGGTQPTDTQQAHTAIALLNEIFARIDVYESLSDFYQFVLDKHVAWAQQQ